MADPRPDWSRWALLLIDAQEDFWTPAHRRAFPRFPERVGELLARCREEGIEVVHVRSRFRADRSDWMLPYRLLERIPCVEGTDGVHVLPFAAEAAGEAVFWKRTFDAFQTAEVAAHLHGRGRRILMTAGLETSYCVLLSSASASQQGFLTLLAEDCCADAPGLAPAVTADFLDRYEGRVFWRAPFRELLAGAGAWAARLPS